MDNEYITHSFNLEDRWTAEVLSRGYVVIPNILIKRRKEIGISPKDFYVLAAILSYQFDTRNVWPSLKTLSERTGLSQKTITRSTNRLEEAGLLYKHHRYGASNVYDLQNLGEHLQIVENYYSKYEGQ